MVSVSLTAFGWLCFGFGLMAGCVTCAVIYLTAPQRVLR